MPSWYRLFRFLKGHQLKFNIPFLLFSKQLKALRRINKFKLNYNLFKVKYKKVFDITPLSVNHNNAEFFYHCNAR